jgi:regulator of protease activity HflC (stomatin/prohibitin superfamily)
VGSGPRGEAAVLQAETPSSPDFAMEYLTIVVVIALLILALWMRGQFTSTTIYQYEQGLRFERGRLTGVLEPGLYWHVLRFTSIRHVDLRSRNLAVSGQEVLSADGVAVKASLTATYSIVDARQTVLASEDYSQSLYAELQNALRTAIAGSKLDGLLASRADLGTAMREQVSPAAAKLGLALEAVVLRDLTLPGELKKIYAQVVQARQEGLAALERARGETAALRSLANAAQLVERNPQLLQLRLLQVAGQQPGNTLVLGMQNGIVPVTTRPAPRPPSAEGEADISG